MSRTSGAAGSVLADSRASLGETTGSADDVPREAVDAVNLTINEVQVRRAQPDTAAGEDGGRVSLESEGGTVTVNLLDLPSAEIVLNSSVTIGGGPEGEEGTDPGGGHARPLHRERRADGREGPDGRVHARLGRSHGGRARRRGDLHSVCGTLVSRMASRSSGKRLGLRYRQRRLRPPRVAGVLLPRLVPTERVVRLESETGAAPTWGAGGLSGPAGSSLAGGGTVEGSAIQSVDRASQRFLRGWLGLVVPRAPLIRFAARPLPSAYTVRSERVGSTLP